jgi:hypothetical protein
MEMARIRTGQCNAHVAFVFAMPKTAEVKDKEVSKVLTLLPHSDGLFSVSVRDV